MKKSLAAIQQSLERLDKTLVEAAANAGSKMQHQLEQLRSRAARAELRQSEILGRHAELLSNALYPNKVLQEREIGRDLLLRAPRSGASARSLRHHPHRLPGSPDHFPVILGKAVKSKG